MLPHYKIHNHFSNKLKCSTTLHLVPVLQKFMSIHILHNRATLTLGSSPNRSLTTERVLSDCVRASCN